MNLERLNQIEEVYHAVRETPAGGREAVLYQQCGADADLRREVESLLAFEGMPENFLDAPPEALAAEMFPQEETRANLTSTAISHYKIINLLGAGGMGEVYLAEDTKLDRKVALKILPTAFAEDAVRMSRFVREAKSASALNHPNIITIHEISEADGTHFIATEFIDGKTLNEYAKSSPLDFKSALEIAIQIASALNEAHSAGIVHRDLKPDNVMVRPNGLVKILDFGIAKLSGSTSRPGLDAEAATAIKSGTTPGMIIGTASYMSPEQAKGRGVDARSDIFSFGVCLYEMLTGRLPFTGENSMDVIGAILHKEPAPIDELEVSPDIRRIVEKCLRKECDKRYRTAKDLLIDLKGVWQQLEFQNKPERTTSPNREEARTQVIDAPASEVSHTTSSAEYIVGEVKKHKLVWLGALGVLIVALAAAGYFTYFRAKPINSIAVLPFVNESGNADFEYLSDGMTETLIKSLSQLLNLNVKPRSSVFRYKGKDKDLPTIAKELNVQAILNGRVAQRGDRLTLSLELVDVSKDSVIWSEQYNRKHSDLVSLQSEIARDVSTKLKSKLSGADEAKVTKTPTANPEAYQLYLRGRYQWNKRTGESLKQAVDFFNQAIAQDPTYALAYAGLADSYVLFSGYAISSPQESFPKAKAAAQKALEFDETLAEAHVVLGYILFNYEWRFAESNREFQRAIELDQNYATAHHWYGNANLLATGRFDEAIAEMQRAQELDPLSVIISADLGTAYLFARQYDKAIEQLHKTIEMDQNFYYARIFLGRAYELKGSYQAAIVEYQQARQLSDDPRVLMVLGHVYALMGERNKSLEILHQLQVLAKQRYVSAYYFAIIYTALGDKERAFQWLEMSYQAREGRITLMRVEPYFDSLHSDPRFQDLVRRVGLPQ